jgi:hypothetical protein
MTVYGEISIDLYSYVRCREDTMERDYISIYNQKFYVDELVYGRNFKKNKNYLCLSWTSIYHFSFNQKKYIAAFITDAINSTFPMFATLLFDITKKGKAIPYFLGFQRSDTMSCWGDFNKDGKLDFIFFEEENQKVLAYTLDGKKFKPILDKYLIITGKSRFSPLIDIYKSNWFYNLR